MQIALTKILFGLIFMAAFFALLAVGVVAMVVVYNYLSPIWGLVAMCAIISLMFAYPFGNIIWEGRNEYRRYNGGDNK